MSRDVEPARFVGGDGRTKPFLFGHRIVGIFEAPLLELDIADHHLIFVDAPLDDAVDRRDFHHFQRQIAELVRGKERAVRPAERHPGDVRLRLQLGQEDEFALVRLAGLQHVLQEQGANGGVRGARFGGDDGDLLFNRRDDLAVDGVGQRVAVGFGGPPPQQMDADGAHQDRCEDQPGNGKANADSHDGACLLAALQCPP